MSIKNTSFLNFKKIFFILTVFVLGLLTERFDFDNKILNYLSDSVDDISRFFYSSNEKIYVDIKQDKFNKILKNREENLKQNRATGLQEWVSAILTLENEKHKIKIRLKGVYPDHWSHPNRWSFKVKTDNDSKPILEMKRFAIQPPHTLNYIFEWLFMKSLKKENLISLRVKYIDLILNGNNLGTYLLQEQISDNLLKNNNRVLGPIIGFSQDLWIKEANNADRIRKYNLTGSLNGLEDSFYRAKIEPVQFNNRKIGTDQEKFLQDAIYKLEMFRKGQLKTSEVFDINQLSKVMVLKAIMGSAEFDWMDTKFYYNPETKLLETISKEIHIDLELNYDETFYTWWIDSNEKRDDLIKDKNIFLDLIYKDKIFYKKYLEDLNLFSNKNYFENLIQENKKEIKKILKKLNRNYPTKKVYSPKYLKKSEEKVRDTMNPVQDINAYFVNYDFQKVSLVVSNLQRLPAEIIGLEFDDGDKIYLDEPVILDGKKLLLPTENMNVDFACSSKRCTKKSIDKQKIIFKLWGNNKEMNTSISPFYYKNQE